MGPSGAGWAAGRVEPRLAGLDSLRGVAILLVLFRHFPTAPPSCPGVVVTVSSALQRCGWAGVDLFFVLSGFLVSGLIFGELQRTGGFAAGRFLLRRGFKIYPLFYVTIGLVLAAMSQSSFEPPPRAALIECLFLQNYLHGLMPHTWSLAVEEHFYLLLALIAWAVTRRHGSGSALPGTAVRPVILAFLAIAFACLAGRAEAVARGDLFLALGATHNRIDALVCGVVLSYLHHFRREWLSAFVARRRLLLLVAAGILVAPTLLVEVSQPVFAVVGLTGVYLGAAALLLVVVHAGPSRGRIAAALAWVGVRSYAIYLVHILAAMFVMNLQLTGGAGYAVLFASYVVLALAAGALLTRLIERPALRLRDRLVPAPAAALNAAPPAP